MSNRQIAGLHLECLTFGGGDGGGGGGGLEGGGLEGGG